MVLCWNYVGIMLGLLSGWTDGDEMSHEHTTLLTFKVQPATKNLSPLSRPMSSSDSPA